MIGGNNGTLTNGVVFVTGEAGEAFGLYTNQAMVLVGSATNLQLQDFTIEAWIQRGSTSLVTDDPTSPGGDAGIFGFGHLGYSFGLRGDGILLLSQVDANAEAASAGVTDTNFHHVAVTKSASAVNFYIDGRNYPATAYNPVFQFSTGAAIGGRGDTLQGSFFGAIDEVSVYSRALAASEIAGLFAVGGGGKCPPAISDATQTVFSPLRFLSVKQTGATVTFVWTAVAGRSYQVQYKSALTQAVWLNLSNPVTANGSTLSVTDVMGQNSQRFYRIVQLP